MGFRFLAIVAVALRAGAADSAGRAVEFLARETPQWRAANHCFSCHNNGDGARALLRARSRGYAIAPAALADSLEWLRKPETWDETSNPAFSDVKLARVQFASALAEAVRDGLTAQAELLRAADSLLPLQDAGGAWKIDTGGVAGAPATYGAALATYMARRTLETADAQRFAAPIARANRWLAGYVPANLPDRAAVLLALPDTASRLMPPLLAAQNGDGGWGPELHAPSEAFDTALALLALAPLRDSGAVAAVARGRDFLSRFQLPDGSWPETTRPSGLTSYAERISTAAWATYALLATDGKRQ